MRSLKNKNNKLSSKIKFYKIESIAEERKLLSSMNGKWTNQKFVDRTSKLIGKRADDSFAKKRSLKRLIL